MAKILNKKQLRKNGKPNGKTLDFDSWSHKKYVTVWVISKQSTVIGACDLTKEDLKTLLKTFK